MSKRMPGFSRRRFLKTSAFAGVSVVIGANGQRVVAETATPEASPLPTTFSESPLLADQVAAGSLPAVADRLPKNPMVVTPVEQVGNYGGTWRTALVGGGDSFWLTRTIGYDFLLRWDPDWTETVPNIAASYEASDDARSYTFTLREGLRWSDGEPFTSADVEFYVNDVYRNADLTSSQGVNPYTISVADELTFTLTWEKPEGFALKNMCSSAGTPFVAYPKHYLSQFHKDYNTENLDALVAEEGAADWVELFRKKGGSIPGTPYNAIWANPELPRMHAWAIKEPYGDTTRVSAERNPYYFKVDTAGNQLPYLDSVTFDVMQDAEVLLLKAANGEIDFTERHINTNQNKPVLADSLEKANIRFFDLILSDMNINAIALNLNHKDEVLRDIFQNRDFRVGLSLAINRQEIIDTVFVGQDEAWQLSPRRDLPFFNETLAKQYTEYDIDAANELLDKVLPDKDGDGMRLRPDGKKISIVIEVSTSAQQHVDSGNMVAGYWKEVGVDAVVKPEDRSLLFARAGTNDHDCLIWTGDGGFKDAMFDSYWYFPQSADSYWAVAWGIWYSKPADPGVAPQEPPEAAKQQMDLYDQLRATADPDKQDSLFADILAIAQEQFWAMGINLPGPGYGFCKVNMRNVPEVMPESALFVTPGPVNPQQFYYE